MGMDPVTMAAIVTAIGGAGGRIFAPQGQKLSSFQGAGDLDPHATLHEAKGMLESVFGQALNRANSPVNMSDAYVQDPPSFSGGGLPVPVGVTGSWGGGKTAFNAHGGLDEGTGTGAHIGISDPPFPQAGADTSQPFVAGDNVDGNSQQPADISKSLFRTMGMPAPAASADTGASGPVRRSATSATMPGANPSIDVSGNGAGDTRALGAVSLLLHLAQNEGGNSQSLLAKQPQQRAAA